MEMLCHEKTRFKICLLFFLSVVFFVFVFVVCCRSCFDAVSMQYRYSIDTVSIKNQKSKLLLTCIFEKVERTEKCLFLDSKIPNN